MTDTRWLTVDGRPPGLDRAVLITAFEGWNDAGNAASGAVEYLSSQWNTEAVAEISSSAVQQFFDFATTRPDVSLDDSGERRVVWPTITFEAGRLSNVDRDVLLVSGPEPQLEWRRFIDMVLGTARTAGCDLLVNLGALLSDVPHTRPVTIYANGYDPETLSRLPVETSSYEGTTGIVGVLNASAPSHGLGSASLWAAVPTYLQQSPSPPATLALVEALSGLLDTGIVTTDLEIAAASYDRQVNELVDGDLELAEMISELERHHDEMDASDSLVDEVERFLREHPDE